MKKFPFWLQIVLIIPSWIMAILKLLYAIPLMIIGWANDIIDKSHE